MVDKPLLGDEGSRRDVADGVATGTLNLLGICKKDGSKESKDSVDGKWNALIYVIVYWFEVLGEWDSTLSKTAKHKIYPSVTQT